jgi:hypothetical protein
MTTRRRTGQVRAETPLGPTHRPPPNPGDAIQNIAQTQREQMTEFVQAATRVAIACESMFQDFTILVQQASEALEHLLQELKEEEK